MSRLPVDFDNNAFRLDIVHEAQSQVFAIFYAFATRSTLP